MKPYFRLLWNHPTPIRFAAARLLMVTGFCRALTIPQRGFRIRFDPSNSAMSLWMDPGCRNDDHAFLRAWAKPGDQCLDIGANIGEVALGLAVAVGEEGRVLALEPHPRTCGFLRGNVALNGLTNLKVVNAGAGDEAGVMRLTDSLREDMNHLTKGEGIDVRIERIDGLVADWDRIDLLKLDVEGYELPVLRGVGEVMGRVRCVVFEICEENFQRFGYGTRDVHQWVNGAGFRLFRSPGPGRLEPVTLDYRSPDFENVIGVRDPEELGVRTGWEVVG